MRHMGMAMAGLAVLIIAGCHCHRTSACVDRMDPELSRADWQPELASGLLFDRRPGRYRAADFAQRSDWPSTTAYYSPGQVITFSHRFVDYQHLGTGESDSIYRRSESQRFGIGYR